MDIKEIIAKLESSDEFVRWKKQNPKSYLTHVLNIVDGHCFGEWQIGYYNKKRDKITVFEVGDPIIVDPESEVFKEEKALVKALDKEKIKVDVNQALELANKIMKSKYPQIQPLKSVIIIQNIELGQVWNLTFVSNSFDVLNIKISSEDGKVLSHDLKPIFQFDSKKKS